jgi:hypothetical protein
VPVVERLVRVVVPVAVEVDVRVQQGLVVRVRGVGLVHVPVVVGVDQVVVHGAVVVVVHVHRVDLAIVVVVVRDRVDVAVAVVVQEGVVSMAVGDRVVVVVVAIAIEVDVRVLKHRGAPPLSVPAVPGAVEVYRRPAPRGCTPGLMPTGQYAPT